MAAPTKSAGLPRYLPFGRCSGRWGSLSQGYVHSAKSCAGILPRRVAREGALMLVTAPRADGMRPLILNDQDQADVVRVPGVSLTG